MPLSFCQGCKRKSCLKTGVPCSRVEKLLPKFNSGKISSKEISVDPLYLDKSIYGHGKGKINYYEDELPLTKVDRDMEDWLYGRGEFSPLKD